MHALWKLHFKDRIYRYDLSADKRHLCVVTGSLQAEGRVRLLLHYFTSLLTTKIPFNVILDLGVDAGISGLACSRKMVAYSLQ